MIQIFNDEALKKMDELINTGIIVDAIICDPPYGTTACTWDKIIDFTEMWKRIEQIIKPNGVVILFSAQPFTAKLINSNHKFFRYEYIWEKNRVTNFLNAKKMPMRKHENILVFYKKLCTYNPQNLIKLEKPLNKNGGNKSTVYRETKANSYKQEYTNYPHSILKFDCVSNNFLHPTEKPVALLEFLIKTYTNEEETVLDFAAGSFSCAEACINTNRNFIGIELNETYFERGKKRLENKTN